MAKKPITKTKTKAQTVIKRKAKPATSLSLIAPSRTATPQQSPQQSYSIQSVGRRHIALRTGTDGYEMELLVTTDRGEWHLATLVFEPAEAKKFRDALAALVK